MSNKKIKIIFESSDKKYGYLIDKDTGTYQACVFDDKYEASSDATSRAIEDKKQFSQRLQNILLQALEIP